MYFFSGILFCCPLYARDFVPHQGFIVLFKPFSCMGLSTVVQWRRTNVHVHDLPKEKENFLLREECWAWHPWSASNVPCKGKSWSVKHYRSSIRNMLLQPSTSCQEYSQSKLLVCRRTSSRQCRNTSTLQQLQCYLTFVIDTYCIDWLIDCTANSMSKLCWKRGNFFQLVVARSKYSLGIIKIWII